MGTEIEAGVSCPYCGHEHDVDARFCDHCGRELAVVGTRATFGIRYAAFLVDLTIVLLIWIVSSFVTQPLSSALAGRTGLRVAGFEAAGAVGTVIQVLLLPLVSLLYFGISEGLRGRTIGKRIVGSRVQKLSGDGPGLARGLLRATVFWGPLLMMIVGQMLSALTGGTLAGALVRLGAVLFMLVTIGNLILLAFWPQRRGVHDLVAGTEIVRG